MIGVPRNADVQIGPQHQADAPTVPLLWDLAFAKAAGL
jgi:hypothetical protein